jgi:adenine-specific DNA methylase
MRPTLPLFRAAGVQAPQPPATRFQGSKYKLLDWIWEHVSQLPFDTVLDAFGGSGCVSHFFKGMGKAVTFNDILLSNSLCAQAIVANDGERLEQEDVALVLTRHPSFAYKDFIAQTFRDIYFTDAENEWLDVVAQNIPRLPTLNKRALAYFALFQSAISKRPYNLFHRKNLYMRTAEVERSFGNKSTWDKSFEDHFRAFVAEANEAVFSTGRECKALNLDACQVPGAYDLVYIDPPYINGRGTGVDYHGFYHFLEGLAAYDEWPAKVDYKSKHRRLVPVKSPWANPRKIREAFRSVFCRFAHSILVVSYRSDGIPGIEELGEMVREVRPKVEIYTLNGNYTYVLSTNRGSTETLIVGTS